MNFKLVICNTTNSERDIKESIQNKRCVLIPIYHNDLFYPKLSKISIMVILELESNKLFVIPVDHSETGILFDYYKVLELTKSLFVLDKKSFLYHCPESMKNQIHDLNLIPWFHRKKIYELDFGNDYSFYDRSGCTNVTSLIPISKIVKHLENIIYEIQLIDFDSIEFSTDYMFYDRIISLFQEIEQAGICCSKDVVDVKIKDKLNNYNVYNDILFSKYNLYTTTGRPTCTSNSINLSALNKKDGSRDFIVSRFPMGKLVEFDYEAYHIRIIADVVGYVFPNTTPIYNFLGKYYFGKDVDTDLEYSEAKKITFKQLYGGIDPVYKDIEYFRLVDAHIKTLWKDWNSSGYIVSPVSQRKFYKTKVDVDMNPQKLFNYFIQILETEYSSKALTKVHKILNQKNSKIILYQYDSFLVDIDCSEDDIIKQCKLELESMGFVVRCKIGNNYSNMKLLEIPV